MCKKKMMITGANGMMGKQAAMYFRDKYIVVAKSRKELDITDYSAVAKVFAQLKPDITLNCAMLRNEKCEDDEILAYRVNTIGTFNLASMSSKYDSVLMHISSDYVFDGISDRPYIETDKPNPVTIYGFSKYYGEQLALTINKRTFVARTAWLYGAYGNNFVHKIIDIAKCNNRLQVVADQVGSPTSVTELLIIIDKLICSGRYGIYHAVCTGQVSRYVMAERIVELMGIDCIVEATQTKDMTRIWNTALSNYKLWVSCGYAPSRWEQALKDYVSSMREDQQ